MALVGLRSEIHTIHTDLNTLQSSLHKEFSALYATTPVQADAQEKTDIQTLSQTEQTVCCPSNLLRRVQAIEKELPVLEERAVRIRDEKMEVVKNIEQLMHANQYMLEQIENIHHNSNNNNNSTTNKHTHQNNNNNKYINKKQPQRQRRTHTHKGPSKQLYASNASKKNNKTLRKRTIKVKNTFTEDQFQHVATSIRGRSKFEDVKKLYTTISRYFAKLKRKRILYANSTVTIKQLSSMGAKVTGHTAQCMLNTLRHLRLISMSKKGITLAKRDRARR